MAELIESSNRKQKVVNRGKKLTTKVDLTPMVDLGFLLITFFIFTTTMSQPTAMRFITPDDRDTTNPTLAAESKTISLILKENDTIDYYFGMNNNNLTTTTYDKMGLRKVLIDKQQMIRLANGSNGDMVVLIKPTAGATYKNIVDVMDEMLINGIKKYAVVE